MIIDVNASLGHYPFRRLRYTSAAALLGLMDRNGIDQAVVTSLHAVFYRDAHRGNEDLFEETKPHRSRLIPVATLNPRYAGWQRDLAEAVARWKMKAVALVPEHHGYRLNDNHGRAAFARIAGYGLPVVLTQRLEDRRQRHAWDRAEDLGVQAIVEAAQAFPNMKFLLSNWARFDGLELARAGLKGRCLIDFARMPVVMRKCVPQLVETLGAEAVAFGSHMPFDYVGPSLIKLANLEALYPADSSNFASRNAARFLGLDA
jgi:predicted TIM-barrel fold metal-dependent hydrolase